jgi:hypothetical protein
MLNPESYITKDGSVFYFELEEYNQKSDVPFEEGDSIKFTYDGQKYIAIIASVGSKKNVSYTLEITRKLG